MQRRLLTVARARPLSLRYRSWISEQPGRGKPSRHRSGVHSHLSASSLAAQPLFRMQISGSGGGYTKFGRDVQEAALRSGGSPRDANWGHEPEQFWGTLSDGEAENACPTVPGAWQDFYHRVALAVLDRSAITPVPPSEIVHVIAIIDACRESANTGAVVYLKAYRGRGPRLREGGGDDDGPDLLPWRYPFPLSLGCSSSSGRSRTASKVSSV